MNVRSPSKGFADAFRKEYGLGRENWAELRRRVRDDEEKAENAPRIVEMMEAHPGMLRLRQNLGKVDSNAEMIREDMGMGLEPKGKGRRAGQMLGAMAADLTQDTSRGFYWLLNALQATGAVITETAYGTRRPDLFDAKPVLGPDGNKIYRGSNDDVAIGRRLIDGVNKKTKRGIRLKEDKKDGGAYYVEQNYAPGDVNALLIPSGIAINTGLGLMTPFGGAEGYEAALPSADDKTKTDNVIQEVALKYVMGRTGNLLPYEEFKKVRPDVSRGEYNAYKAFKYDKKNDLDLTDGDMTVLAGGLKATTEGIHGPEIQFLGRGLPLTTGVIPFASAVAGTTIGVGAKGSTRKPIRGGLVGGMAGLAVGQVAGNLIEGERRRRNKADNERGDLSV